MLGKPYSEIATQRDDEWKLRPDALERHCASKPNSPRLLILNYPNNPTGLTYTESELKDLADIARKHQLLILSDEIYGGLHFSGTHISIARFYPQGTILCTGLSKSWGAGGWRLGAFVFPPSLRFILERMIAAASETFSCVSAPIQYASIPAFEDRDEINTYQLECRRILSTLGNWVASKLKDTGAVCPSPHGGFYAFPDWSHLADRFHRRNITNGSTLCETLLTETGVATLAGSAFGRPNAEFNVRIAFVDFDGTQVLEALSTIPVTTPLDPRFLESHCSRVVQGTHKLYEWIQSTQ
jgi:aspartate aminotransferase